MFEWVSIFNWPRALATKQNCHLHTSGYRNLSCNTTQIVLVDTASADELLLTMNSLMSAFIKNLAVGVEMIATCREWQRNTFLSAGNILRRQWLIEDAGNTISVARFITISNWGTRVSCRCVRITARRPWS